MIWKTHNQPCILSLVRIPQTSSSSTFLQQQLTITHSHIIAQTTMAQKDQTGNFSWVEFKPEFHTHLVKWAFSLLSKPITPSAQQVLKKTIFIFILEILNQEREAEFFTLGHGGMRRNSTEQEKKWLACKHQHATKQEHTCKESEPPEVQPSRPTPLVNAEGLQYAPLEATKPETQTPIPPTPPQPTLTSPTADPTTSGEPITLPPPTPPPPPPPAKPEPTPNKALPTPAKVREIEMITKHWRNEFPRKKLGCRKGWRYPCPRQATHIVLGETQWTPTCKIHTAEIKDSIPIPENLIIFSYDFPHHWHNTHIYECNPSTQLEESSTLQSFQQVCHLTHPQLYQWDWKV